MNQGMLKVYRKQTLNQEKEGNKKHTNKSTSEDVCSTAANSKIKI